MPDSSLLQALPTDRRLEAEACMAVMASVLAAATEPEAGGALYDLHAPDALMVVDRQRLAPARTVDRDAYAREHRETVSPAAPFRRKPQLATLTLLGFDREGDRAVAWFGGHETEDDRPVTLGAGFERHGEAWRFSWATLTESPQPWRYAEGRMHAASEFPLVALADPERFWRSAHEIAYYRLYDLPRPPLVTLPEARFSCHSSGVCCRFDFQILLSPAAQDYIDAVPWAEIEPSLVGTTLPVREDGMLQLKEKGEQCRFLDEHRHCRVHKLAGRAVFSPCAAFPFSFAETPEGVAVSTSYVCGSVRQNLGLPLQERADDLYYRMAHSPAVRTDAYKLAHGREVSWEEFKDAESALIALLDRTDLPFHRRLWLGSRLLSNWPDRTLDPAWEQEPIEPLPDGSRVMIQEILIRGMLEQSRAAFKALDGQMMTEAAHDQLRQGDLLAGLYKNLYHAKVLSYSYDLTTAHNLLIILYLVVLHLEAYFPEGLQEDFWQELGALGSHNIIALFLRHSTPIYHDFFGQADFGHWLLRYPLDQLPEA